ncbi:hypothetical protein GGR53DRAFT_461234 [Hypoxylon sp. FL1150]|nr:hypothetical protein GGR53DRAFT_461234 [Hypoxylon sp. FL1150]
MERPESQIRGIIRSLTEGSREEQERVLEHYFLPDAYFTHPFCRVPSFGDYVIPFTNRTVNSLRFIYLIYQWYHVLSPDIKLDIDSVAFDKQQNQLYVSLRQTFTLWFVPFSLWQANVRLVTVLNLDYRPIDETGKPTLSVDGAASVPTSDADSDINMQYFIKGQEDHYQVEDFVKFVAPWGASFLWILWQLFATVICAVGVALLRGPVAWFRKHILGADSWTIVKAKAMRTDSRNTTAAAVDDNQTLFEEYELSVRMNKKLMGMHEQLMEVCVALTDDNRLLSIAAGTDTARMAAPELTSSESTIVEDRRLLRNDNYDVDCPIGDSCERIYPVECNYMCIRGGGTDEVVGDFPSGEEEMELLEEERKLHKQLRGLHKEGRELRKENKELETENRELLKEWALHTFAPPYELPSDEPSTSKLRVVSGSTHPRPHRAPTSVDDKPTSEVRPLPLSYSQSENCTLKNPGKQPRTPVWKPSLKAPGFTNGKPGQPKDEYSTPPPYESALAILSHAWKYENGDTGKETGEDATIWDRFETPEIVLTKAY